MLLLICTDTKMQQNKLCVLLAAVSDHCLDTSNFND